MYTSFIGKHLLRLYAQKTGKEISARRFFDEVMFPLFFDDDRHLLHVGNSPFFQPPSAKDIAGGLSKSQVRLANLHQNIANDPPNMAIFVGYAAKDPSGTTSGQVTNIPITITGEDMYASWIGEALAIGVSGGFVFLLNQPDVLWTLYEGWAYYRKYLNQSPSLKANQIETWNGHWLAHCFGKNYDPGNPMYQMEPDLADNKEGQHSIASKDWVRIVFALSRKFPGQSVTIYAYSLSKTNITLGFINVLLPQVNRFFEMIDNLMHIDNEESLSSPQVEQMYETYYRFKEACKLGVIGLKAIEPAHLREYMPKPFGRGKDFSFDTHSANIYFQIYKTWIIAMLSNKTELNELAHELATALHAFEIKGGASSRGKSTDARLTEEVRTAPNLIKFIDKLSEVMDQRADDADLFRYAKDTVLKMPADLFPLFITLLRFEYTYLKTKKA